MKTSTRILLVLALFVPFSAAPADFTHPGIATTPDDCLPKYPPPPLVKISVRVPACMDPGDLIQYRICVENCSTAEAHHVMVKNVLPGNAKFVKADPMPTKQGEELQWQLGTVGGGATREIILVLQPTNKEDVKNCARVQFEHGQCVVTRQTGSAPGGPPPTYVDPSMPSIPGTPAKPPKITTVPDAKDGKDVPELELTVRGPKDQYANLASKYEITVVNRGKAKATGVLVSSRMPEQLKIGKASAPGVIVDNEVAWLLGQLDPGATKVMELTLRANDKGEYCFKTTLQADLGVKKEAEFCTKFVGVSAMTIEMYDTVDPVFLGNKTSYPVIIRNQGSVPVTNVRLRAFVPDSLKLDKANAAIDKQQAIKGGLWIEFPALPKIDVGLQARYEIFVEAAKAGYTRFHVEVMADQLDPGLWVIEEESTTIVDDREKVQIKELSRKKS